MGIADNKNNTKVITSNQINEIILDGRNFSAELIADIDNATKTIDLETYIYQNDSFGEKVANAIIRAVKRGVKVRLLVDGIGTPWSNYIAEMEKCGVNIHIFHPFPLSLWQLKRNNKRTSILRKILYFFQKINIRNHRKTCIIDDKIAYIGSINIMQSQLDQKNGGEEWLDVSVKVTNIELDDLQEVFDAAWESKEINRITLCKAHTNPIFRLNNTRHQRRVLYRSFLKQIKEAKERIWLISAYFNPDIRLMNALEHAALKGIDVKILLPHKSDLKIMPSLAITFYKSLLRSNVKIYEYIPSILHAKVIIIDSWYCVGTSNLNHRSLLHDLEVDINIQTFEAKEIINHQFVQNLNLSKTITLSDVAKAPWYKVLLGKLLLLIRIFF